MEQVHKRINSDGRLDVHYNYLADRVVPRLGRSEEISETSCMLSLDSIQR